MLSQINRLEKSITDLGQLVEIAISRAVTALLDRDTLIAKAVVEHDVLIDKAEVEVQELCLSILEELRPTGEELRFVVAVLKINDGLERIGDLAQNVAEVVLQVADWDRFVSVTGCRELATQSQLMLKQCMRAVVERDVKLAASVIDSDDIVDRMQDKIKERIEFELDRNPENANALMKLENVTRQFERIGDMATNIAEEVIYLVDGEIVRHRKRFGTAG